MKPIAIVIHHEGKNNGFDRVNEYHKRKWNFKSSLGYYIGYGYYIALNGTVTQGRADTEEQAHTLGGWNRKSIGICLQGNLDLLYPTSEQLLTLQDLIGRKQVEHSISNNKIYMHKELWLTACPGKNMIDWVKSYRESDITYLQIMINQVKSAISELKGRLSRIKK